MPAPENGQATASSSKKYGLPANEEVPELVRPVTATKKPPSESRESVNVRRSVLVSFWLLVLCVGVPFWWQTTTVYRANLPYSTMDAWASGSACQYTIPLNARFEATSLDASVIRALKDRTQVELSQWQNMAPHKTSVSLPNDRTEGELEPAISIGFVEDGKLAEPSASLGLSDGGRSTRLLTKMPKSFLRDNDQAISHIASLLAEELQSVFEEEIAMITRVEDSRRGEGQDAPYPLLKEKEDKIERRQQRSMKYASTYHLTFSLFTPESTPSDWEIETALADTIKPLLNALSPMCNFTVDTQIQPYAQFSSSVQPVYNSTRKTWELKSSDLGGFINAAEWPLSPSIGAGPTINFLLYVPSSSQAPLKIEDTDSTSWLILQWGGIAIHNPVNLEKLAKTSTLTAQELQEPFLTFSQHLLDLLGLPSPNLPFQMRLQSQTRILAVRLLSSASATLGSLARLTQSLTSISIPDTVASSVDSTTTHLQAACAALNAGDYQTALDNAKVADEEAEKAFFHKSMVGQVYFPDEHKVAVYLPLLGPVAVPLVMTAIKELRAWFQARKGSG
ncbi:MAG: hypothetical protein Q9162_000251 [Coniocarpon cinnabarinum]